MRKIITFFALAIVVAIAAAAGFGWWVVYDDRRLPVSPVTVEVAPGETVDDIAAQLGASGVVSWPQALSLYLRARKLTTRIQAADYDFPAHATVAQVADVLAAGGRPAEVWVTIPEGFTAAQIAARLLRRGLDASAEFMTVVHTTDLTVGPWRSHGLEGFLYPDTYLVPRHGSATQVAGLMTAEFEKNLPAHAVELARHLGYSIPQIVTIASMIEREAKVDAERPVIAGVIYNRLRIGMPLEIDATIEYALPQHKQVLSFHDLAVDSPYNTYRHRGLPPTPIANPGKRSLLAAFHPASVPYLYYVYRGNGRHEFSRTLEEQQAAERRFLH
ncbi:MAG TPA: endolytic transglycosylase MltG [Candidatus Acidoferrales bacterium]|nr:endolytic transglycosylase MltG [Candidatus Acidoferrales bacterium]